MHLQLIAVLFGICIIANNIQTSFAGKDVTNSTSSTVEDESDEVSNTTATAKTNGDDKSAEDTNTVDKYDHTHQDHHQQEATVTVDVHNVLDLFKEQLKQTEQRIIAAIKEQDHSSSSSKESYRTADRTNKNKKDEKKKSSNKDEDDQDD